MLHWIVLLLVVAASAAALSVGGAAVSATLAAQVLFSIATAVFVLNLFLTLVVRGRGHRRAST